MNIFITIDCLKYYINYYNIYDNNAPVEINMIFWTILMIFSNIEFYSLSENTNT